MWLWVCGWGREGGGREEEEEDMGRGQVHREMASGRDTWREMLRVALPGALTTGKPDDLSTTVWFLGSQGSSVCLSVCLVQGTELSTLHMVDKCYASELLPLSFLSVCRHHRRSGATPMKFNKGLWGGQFLEWLLALPVISIERSLQCCLELTDSLQWLLHGETCGSVSSGWVAAPGRA